MRKEDIASAVIYLLMIAVAIIVGLTVIKDAFGNLYDFSFNVYAFAIIVILVGLLFNIIMLEVLHVFGGKIGGYSVVSFNVLGFCWSKTLGKWKFKFSDFDGLTGETKLAPKSKEAKLNWVVWLPLLGYLTELALGIVLFSMGSKQLPPHDPRRWIAIASMLFVIISSMIALYNFIPVKLDSMTDGYRLTLIGKKVNVEALNELMRIENLQREGLPVDNVKIFTEITDFTANLNLFHVYECLAKKEYDKAIKLIDTIIEVPEKMSSTTYNRLLAQKLYVEVINSSKEDAKKYYDENVKDDSRRFIANDISMESLRAYILIAGILEDSQAEVEYAKSRKAKALKRALPSRAELEDKLFEEAFEMIKQHHPDWEFQETTSK